MQQNPRLPSQDSLAEAIQNLVDAIQTSGVVTSAEADVVEPATESTELELAEPRRTVALFEHGDSSVNFVCRPHVKPEHYWDVWFDTHKKVKEAFDAQGVSIPFPQRDLHMIEQSA